MEGLDAVLRRLEDDEEFRDRLRRRPRDALEGYDLTIEELESLAGRLEATADTTDAPHELTSFSALFAEDDRSGAG